MLTNNVDAVAQSLPANIQRPPVNATLSQVAAGNKTGVDYSDSDEEYDLVQTEETPTFLRQRSYGSTPDGRVAFNRRNGKKRGVYRHSTTVVSMEDLRELLDEYNMKLEASGAEDESEDEEPPIIEMIYRRNCKDKTKLILLPILYFTFMVLAGVFAFYSIDALIESYENRVRSVHDYYVQSYDPIGIAVFLEDFGIFHDCSFKYNDDLAPIHGNFTPLVPAGNCTYESITFMSRLVGTNRTAMVFRGPTQLKESIALNMSINTTLRQFGALEFMLLDSWNSIYSPDAAHVLATTEARDPLYTVPAGFRTWIKMSKTLYENSQEHTSFHHDADFTLSFGFSIYNDLLLLTNQTTNVVLVLFEWKDNKYTHVKEILSTNLFNTVGSLAGIFVAMLKVGELCTAWIKRLRRERKKKLAKLHDLHEHQRKLMEEYEERKKEKEERKELDNKQRLSPLKD